MKLALVMVLLAMLHAAPLTEVVRHDSAATIVKVVPSSYKISTYHGSAPADATLTFNANYFDPKTRQPIGVIMSHGVYMPYLWDRHTTNLRPCLVFTKAGRPFICRTPWVHHRSEMWTAVEGGPTLVEHGRVVNDVSTERCWGEPVSTGRQLSAGVTASGKLYVIYSTRWSVNKLSHTFQGLWLHRCAQV